MENMKITYLIKLSYTLIVFLNAFVNVYGSQPLNSVFFINPNNGWAAGNSGVILKTTDSGTTWEMQDIGNIAKHKEIRHVFFTNAETGWACGSTYDYDYGYVLLFRKTTDGGADWDEIDNPLKGPMYFTDPDTGWASHEFTRNTIYKTTNGGTRWLEFCVDPLSGDLESPHSIIFSDTRNGWILCNAINETRVFRTSDGGKSWTEQARENTNELNSIQFIDSSTGWVCGEKGTVLATIDGVTNWISGKIGASTDLIAICFYNSTIGWTCSESKVYKTTDGGSIWEKIDLIELGNIGALSALHFSDSETAWITTNHGFIIKASGDTASIVKQVTSSEIMPYYYSDSCGDCGSGSQLAFIPMFSCGLLSLFRRKKRKRKVSK